MLDKILLKKLTNQIAHENFIFSTNQIARKHVQLFRPIRSLEKYILFQKKKKHHRYFKYLFYHLIIIVNIMIQMFYKNGLMWHTCLDC